MRSAYRFFACVACFTGGREAGLAPTVRTMATMTLQRMLGIGLGMTGLMLLFLAAGPDGGDVVTQSPAPATGDHGSSGGGGGSANGPTPGAGSGDAGAAASLARQHTRELEARVSALEAENARLRAAVTKAGGGGAAIHAHAAAPPGQAQWSKSSNAQVPSNPANALVDAQLALTTTRRSASADDVLSPISFWAARDAKYSPEAGRQTFRQISDRMRDDKSFRHRYDIAYTLYLEHLRSHSETLSMFEIGLGCDQERIGASVMMWGEYLPNARLTLFEFDEACGKAWAAKHRDLAPKGGFNIFFGDQANADHLTAALKGDGDRLYDVIIDDGGHSMQQQINSFKVLWSRVKRGGVYVVEDLNSSFKTRYGGVRRPTGGSRDGSYAITMTNFLKEMTDQLHALPVPHHPGKFIEDTEFKSPVARIDCHHFICFITKR